jgi:unsaturated chondroitin disaccharide hydrolase
MINIDYEISADDLGNSIKKFWEVSGKKISNIEKQYDASKGSPVFTVKGLYTTRGWTEWTQGFQFGSSLLQFDATGETSFLESGRERTLAVMAPHLTHTGVHDHGFNNVSTYGNLLRLMKEGKLPFNEWEKNFYELALKVSGAVQAARWTKITHGGFIYSFNGPHSLFVDTIRSCRALALSHSLGHIYQAENDIRINILERAMLHCKATAMYSVYYGDGRDSYDIWGRTAHESLFNTNDGRYRAPNSQQGYTGFTTWTRGLAWAICGFAEQLEYLRTISDDVLEAIDSRDNIEEYMLKAAHATCDFYIDNTPTDGVPYWDTGAPQLYRINDYLNKPADPFNEYEPVDSSAAAIACQGLMRFGKYLTNKGEVVNGKKYWQAGLTVLRSILREPYLSTDPSHQGLLLHTVYHWPNKWDYVPKGAKIPYGESCMWGDYHIREAALYVQKIISEEPYYTFYNGVI